MKSLKDIVVVSVRKQGLKPCFEFESKDKKVKIKIKAFETSHRDLSQFPSLGFKIIAGKKDGPKTQIGFTGDAKWKENKWPKHLYECSIICAHLGSIVNVLDKKDFCNTFCSKHDKECKKSGYRDACEKSGYTQVDVTKFELIEQTQDENHLCLAGLSLFFDSLFKNDNNLKVGVISEFGEELKDGIRMDLYKKFDSWFENKESEHKVGCFDESAIIDKSGNNKRNSKNNFYQGISYDKNTKILKISSKLIEENKNKILESLKSEEHKKIINSLFEHCQKVIRCLPGDIGLEIDVFTGNVCCHCCKRFVERDRIEPIPYGKEEAICFVCKECQSVLSSYQIGEKLKDYCENGRKLELADESK